MACWSRSWTDHGGSLWLIDTKCILSNGSLCVPRLMVTECSPCGDCSAQWMLSPQSTESVSLFYFPFVFFFFFFAPWPLVISYIPCHVMFLFLCHCLTLLSPLHLSLMLNVIPPFFRLWFRWHLPRVAVIAKCRLGRWDIGQPSPLLSHPSLTPSLLSGMAIPQFVLNACRVL